MTNMYLKLLQDARALPGAYQAMGTPLQTYTSTRDDTTVTGWKICRFNYGMNEDGDDWWSNEWNLLVDESGDLWELHIGDEFYPNDGGRRTTVNLNRVGGEQLRTWHVNNWDFATIKRSIEAMI
jgi:hypothetical protein